MLVPRLLLHTSFLSPLCTLWLWTKPVARDFLYQAPTRNMTFSVCVLGALRGLGCLRPWPGKGGLTQTSCLLHSCCRPSEGAFDSLRLWVLVALCLLRLAVTRPHLQAYLCLAKARVEQLRKEAGRIEAREIQQRVCTLGGMVPVLRGPSRRVSALGRPPLLQPPLSPPLGGPGLLLRDCGEPAVPDPAHPHSALHTAAQDPG
jgi:hypothetical protein